MKLVTVLALAAVLAGCASMTPTQRKVAYVAGAVAVAAVAVSATDGKNDWRDSSYCGDGRSFCGPTRP